MKRERVDRNKELNLLKLFYMILETKKLLEVVVRGLKSKKKREEEEEEILGIKDWNIYIFLN